MSDKPHPDTRIIDPASEPPGFFYRPQVVKNILRGFFVICAGLLAMDFVFHRHAYVDIEGYWGFYGLFGFVACVVLVLLAKAMRVVVWREESYYHQGEDPVKPSPEASDQTGAGH